MCPTGEERVANTYCFPPALDFCFPQKRLQGKSDSLWRIMDTIIFSYSFYPHSCVS